MENKVKINEELYTKGDSSIKNSGEAYFIEGKWYLSSDCVYDHFLGRYAIKEKSLHLVHGIVAIDEKNDFVFGHFSPSLSNITVHLKNTKRVLCLNKHLIKGLGYIETSSGDYKHYTGVTITDVYVPKKISKDFKSRFPYGAGDVLNQHLEYLTNLKINPSKGAKSLASLLNGLSFGVEFETISGLLTKQECYDNGLIPLRDGSIEGLEYVTVPLTGDKGVQTLYNALTVLGRKTEVNHTCALHFHFGNIPRTESFIVALWKVMSVIQDELYQYQHIYKSDNRGFKTKDYAKRLPSNVLAELKQGDDTKIIKSNYEEIVGYLGMNLLSDKSLNKIESHPADPRNQQKWHVKTRYSILNMVPLIFGNKKTVEFRHHDITVNKNDVIFELLIDAAIINYVLKNEKNIHNTVKNLNLSIILDDIYSKNRSLLDNIMTYLHTKRQILKGLFITGKIGETYDVFQDNASMLNIKQTSYKINEEYATSFYTKYIDKQIEQISSFGGPSLRTSDITSNVSRSIYSEATTVSKVTEDNIITRVKRMQVDRVTKITPASKMILRLIAQGLEAISSFENTIPVREAISRLDNVLSRMHKSYLDKVSFVILFEYLMSTSELFRSNVEDLLQNTNMNNHHVLDLQTVDINLTPWLNDYVFTQGDNDPYFTNALSAPVYNNLVAPFMQAIKGNSSIRILSVLVFNNHSVLNLITDLCTGYLEGASNDNRNAQQRWARDLVQAIYGISNVPSRSDLFTSAYYQNISSRPLVLHMDLHVIPDFLVRSTIHEHYPELYESTYRAYLDTNELSIINLKSTLTKQPLNDEQ